VCGLRKFSARCTFCDAHENELCAWLANFIAITFEIRRSHGAQKSAIGKKIKGLVQTVMEGEAKEEVFTPQHNGSN
jgi:hypothetical protein